MIINCTEKWGKNIQAADDNGARTVGTLISFQNHFTWAKNVLLGKNIRVRKHELYESTSTTYLPLSKLDGMSPLIHSVCNHSNWLSCAD